MVKIISERGTKHIYVQEEKHYYYFISLKGIEGIRTEKIITKKSEQSHKHASLVADIVKLVTSHNHQVIIEE